MKDWNICQACGQELPEDQQTPLYNISYGDEKLCSCGHPYYRHFDTYNDMEPVGCKYCGCLKFKETQQ